MYAYLQRLWDTIAVTPTSGEWFNVYYDPNGHPDAKVRLERCAALQLQESTSGYILGHPPEDHDRETRVVFGQLADNRVEVYEPFDSDIEVGYVGTYHADNPILKDHKAITERYDWLLCGCAAGCCVNSSAAPNVWRWRSTCRSPAMTRIVTSPTYCERRTEPANHNGAGRR
jgi:hypothetical protein